MKSARFWMVFLLLAATALLLHTRASADRFAAREPLSQLPELIDGKKGVDLPIAQDQLDVLGPGDFLSRYYLLDRKTPPVELFIGYFPTQRTGVTIHSPKNCLPGAGWAFESQQYVNLNDVNGKSHRVGEYVIADGERKQFVIYWYQAHGRSVANEYMAKIYLVADAIRMNRTDGALVRVIAPVDSSRSTAEAKQRAERFAAQLLPLLPRYIPD
jgi:EpsI family protein